jgi:AraC-like DNA-binding protein
MDGEVSFQFGPMYMRPMPEGQSFFIYNPANEIHSIAKFPKNHRLAGISISLKRIHSLFLDDEDLIGSNNLPFLSGITMNRPIYDQKSVDSNMRFLLDSLFHKRLSHNAQKVANLGRVLEILALYFNVSEVDTLACPFLKDEETVQKIHQAKSIISNEWKNPPTLKKLSEKTGLNTYRLNVGFKQVYGTTVHNYVMDTKLNNARRMLEHGIDSVNDVAFKIGYTNPSHFIAAFKKRFGITPRKYRVSQ